MNELQAVKKAAERIGCLSSELMSHRMTGEGISVIGHDGKHYRYTFEELAEARAEPTETKVEQFSMRNTKAELLEACAVAGFDTSGNKSDLLERLEG